MSEVAKGAGAEDEMPPPAPGDPAAAPLMSAVPPGFRSGIVALLGRPNVGKSTLVNAVVRARVAIVTPRPQTTRGRIFGVRTTDEYQIAFVDTPGFHRSKDVFGTAMVNVAKAESRGSDLVLLVVDASVPPQKEDEDIGRFLAKHRENMAPIVTVFNKIDLAAEPQAHRDAYRALVEPAAEHFVSAATGHGIPQLEAALVERLMEGPMLFPPGVLTDQDDRTRAAEIIREKALVETHQEVPHALAVDVEEMREGKTPGTRYVRATIYVEKESQKAIVVGKNGAKLKQIGRLARLDMEGVFGEKVFVELWVKVKEEWRRRPDVLRAWGFNV